CRPRDELYTPSCLLVSGPARVIILGGVTSNELPCPLVESKSGEIDVRGSQGHPNTFRPTLDLIALGALPARRLITHRVPLTEISQAFRLLESKGGGVMKVIIEP